MIPRAIAGGLRFAWVVGDEVYGSDPPAAPILAGGVAFRAGCPYRKLCPDILVLESAQEWHGCDAAHTLNRATERRVLGQSEVGLDSIVVPGVSRKNPAQMFLAQHYDMI